MKHRVSDEDFEKSVKFGAIVSEILFWVAIVTAIALGCYVMYVAWHCIKKAW